jgi:hypothetical protein
MNKKILITGLFLILRLEIFAQFTFPVSTILDNGNTANRVKFVFLSDGYTASQLTNFNANVVTFKNYIFTQSPYKEYANFFNFYAIQVPSNQSGADHPANATDESSSGSQPVAIADTYFGGTFDYASIHRLVVCTNYTAINNVLSTNFPTYNQAFLFVNSPYYGGSGGGSSVSTQNVNSSEVAIHEIGHSFGVLADEYEIGGQGERANRTKVTNPVEVRWKNWLGLENVGIFPINIEGWQRPHESCKMRYLGVPFCAVCKESILDKIYNLVKPIDATLPAGSTATISGPTTFSASLILPNPNTIIAEWKLNGETIPSDFSNGRIAAGSTTAIVSPSQLSAGANELVLYVTDETGLSKSFLPNTGYIFSKSWTLNSSPLPVNLIDFQVEKLIDSALIKWETSNENKSFSFEIERGFDAIKFEKIGSVKAAGNSNEKLKYKFIDKNIYNLATYYRLKQIDIDGSFKYSAIRSIDKTEKFSYSIFPSPFTDKINISGFKENNKSIEFEVIDELGKIVTSLKLQTTESNYNQLIQLPNLSAGIYFVIIRFENGYEIKKKIINIGK